MTTLPEKFPGFDTRYNGNYERNFFMYPNILSEYWFHLAGSEQKVLDFILRQTIGWRKSHDKISLDQFANGVGEGNRGTGLSVSQIVRAIKGLEEKGFIEVKRNGNRPATFRLVLVSEENELKANDPKAFDAFRDVRWD